MAERRKTVMFQEQIEINMLESAKHLLKILGKSNPSDVEVIYPRVYRHVSKRGIVTIIHGYLNFSDYISSGAKSKCERCNGFYFTLKKIS